MRLKKKKRLIPGSYEKQTSLSNSTEVSISWRRVWLEVVGAACKCSPEEGDNRRGTMWQIAMTSFPLAQTWSHKVSHATSSVSIQRDRSADLEFLPALDSREMLSSFCNWRNLSNCFKVNSGDSFPARSFARYQNNLFIEENDRLKIQIGFIWLVS